MEKQKRHRIVFLCALVFCFISSIVSVSAEDSAMFMDTVSVRDVSSQCYFGDQLDELSKEIYDVMVQNYVTDEETGDIDADFSVPFIFDATVAGTEIVQDEAFWEAYKQIKDAISRACQAMVKDYPRVFWISSLESGWSIIPVPSKESSTGYKGVVTSYTLRPVAYTYAGADKIETFYNSVATVKEAIEAKLNKDASDYEILKAIHDYLCRELEYNYAALSGDDEYQYAHNVYTVFAGSKMVACEGYAKAFKVLCDEFGIPCILVTGYGVTDSDSDAHMWNYVEMKDEKWYAVDVTWDDQDDGIHHTYFLAGAGTQGFYGYTFSEEHILDTGFAYPVLADERYEYDTESEKQLLAGKTVAENAIQTLTASNITTEEDIIGVVQKAVGSGLAVTVDGFTKTDATARKAGSITGTVTLTLNGTKTVMVPISLEIAKGKSAKTRDHAATALRWIIFFSVCAAAYSVAELKKNVLDGETGAKEMNREWEMAIMKEVKIIAMRILERVRIPYRTYICECEESVDALQTVDVLRQPYEKVYKALMTKGDSGNCYVFVIPIAEELGIEKAAKEVGEKSLSVLYVKCIHDVTEYDSSAKALEHVIVSGGQIGTQVELESEDL